MDGTKYEAQVLFENEDMDIAVIKIEAQGLSPATLGDSDTLAVGEITVAIGNPLGLDQTVTSGNCQCTGQKHQHQQRFITSR